MRILAYVIGAVIYSVVDNSLFLIFVKLVMDSGLMSYGAKMPELVYKLRVMTRTADLV